MKFWHRAYVTRARLAQSAERKALNLVVVGSSPTVGAFAFPRQRCRAHSSATIFLFRATHASHQCYAYHALGIFWGHAQPATFDCVPSHSSVARFQTPRRLNSQRRLNAMDSWTPPHPRPPSPLEPLGFFGHWRFLGLNELHRKRKLVNLACGGHDYALDVHAIAAIAQLGERQTEDLKVPGSIPGLGTCSHFEQVGGPRKRLRPVNATAGEY